MPPEMARIISRPLRMGGESDIRTILTPLRGYLSVQLNPWLTQLTPWAIVLRPSGAALGRAPLYERATLPNLLRSADATLFVIQRDLVLENFLDHHFQIGEVVAIHERTRAVHQLEHAALDEGGQLESAADFVDDFIRLESCDH